MGLETVVERREEQDTAGRWVAIERIRPRPFDATSDRKQSFAFGLLRTLQASSHTAHAAHSIVMHAGYIIYLQSTRNLCKSSPNHLAWMRVRSLLIINGRKDVRFESRPPPQADRDPPPLPDPDPRPRPLPLPLPLPVPLQTSCHRASSSQLG